MGWAMAEIQRAWCDDCRRPVDVVGSIGLCIAYYMVPLFVNVITRETELGEREAFNPTKALIVPMFNATYHCRLGQALSRGASFRFSLWSCTA